MFTLTQVTLKEIQGYTLLQTSFSAILPTGLLPVDNKGRHLLLFESGDVV